MFRVVCNVVDFAGSQELVTLLRNKFLFISQLHHLQEEMVIIKERYAQCNEAKTQLTQDLVSLQQEYSSLIGSSSIVSSFTI
jgi:hypothetical protein